MKQKHLVKVRSGSIGQKEIQTANARELHAFLKVKKDFSDWIKRRIVQGKFTENQDYVCTPKRGSKSGSGGHNIIEYHITIYMAKHLAMMEKTDRGKEARDYFIQCEERMKKLEERILNGKLRNLHDPHWAQGRLDGIAARHECTDHIQKFVEYAFSQGSKNAPKYYKHITNATYKALGFMETALPKDARIRELLDRIGLANLATAEYLVAGVIERGMGAVKFYKDIFQDCKLKLEQFAAVVGRRPLIGAA